jgi:hypothetical protein
MPSQVDDLLAQSSHEISMVLTFHRDTKRQVPNPSTLFSHIDMVYRGRVYSTVQLYGLAETSIEESAVEWREIPVLHNFFFYLLQYVVDITDTDRFTL